MILSNVQLPNQSKKLLLFQLENSDVGQDYVAWLNDPAVNQYLESRFDNHTTDSIKRFVASMNESKTDLLLGIRDIANDKHVGNIKLGLINKHHRTAEVAIMIGDKSVWGKGLAAEAIRLVIDLARELGLRKLTAGCYLSNTGSKRAFEKNGFEVEGIRTAQVLLNNRAEDVMLLGLIL